MSGHLEVAASPLWARVLHDLRDRLQAGEFEHRFPGDLELVAHYGVSRHTVREAVRHLQDEGVLERRRGRGSFVTPKAIEQPLGALYSLFRTVEAQGVEQRNVVRHLDRRIDAEAARVLGLDATEQLVYLERLRLADGEPFALDRSWLPAALAGPLLEVDFGRTALYEELSDRCGTPITAGSERIRPYLPDRAQRAVLGIGTREPCFAVERLASSSGRPVEWRRSIVVGDRFSFVARWSEGQEATGFEAGGS